MDKIKYLKILPFENIKNARNLGGYPTLDGKITSWDFFIRSANLDDSTEKDIKLLEDLNVSTIIDLRRDDEIIYHLDKINALKDKFSHYQISLSPRALRYEEIKRLIEKKDTIGKSYISIIDNFPAIKKVFQIMAEADGKVLFHCQEGKDRTGIISMILLGLAGSFRTDIMADYEISSANLGYVDRYDQNESEAIFRITSPYNIKEALEYIERKYKSFEAYLEYAGVDKKTIEKLKEKMIE
ncbi:MAG: tyrosine-protein phosphatase [Pseudomonas aeruginosa]|nr:tyrosine-protein phosphatase [Pseudomonas aeruginosa]